jgi:hypothetical protein
MLFRLRIAALLAVAALSACQRDDDPARLWSGQTAEAVRIGQAHAVAMRVALPASSPMH